ncbi:glucose dehydrogenase [FAD, quinone] [Polyergus mexicanus]|uniref:glucose dehydrogenase [FAD, quinone] n=1 Tax=Polyergus mexicanus TaxID=615972 RepID=UPI0038B4555A
MNTSSSPTDIRCRIPGYQIPQAPCSSPFVTGLTMENVCYAGSTNLFLNMLSMLTTYSTIINGVCERITPIKRPEVSGTYDFIVVGGGAAGPVVASRLSEIKDWSVLLVEAGPDEPAGTQIPSNFLIFLGTSLDWNYKTTNESHSCLSTNGRCKWPRGKNLGGCTSHHGMAYHRGHEKDYEKWVLMGNIGWSWQEVLPIFKMSENNKDIGKIPGILTEYHGTEGPMTVERFPWQPEFAWDVMRAAEEVGFGTTEDLVGPNPMGFAIAQTMSNNGVRLSASRAYLWPHRNRQNLHIALNATALKVNTARQGSKVTATGITFRMNGYNYNVRAKKEVILSAGTINSPQLLLLSGIGPKNHLDSVNIPTIVDLPGVGENLHNHQSYGIDFNIDHKIIDELNIDNANQYLYNQTGPMSSTGLAQLTGILTSTFTTADDPDIQIFFSGYQATCNTGNRTTELETYNNKETVRFTSVNIQPRSRGRITLASNNPLDAPIIWGNDLAEPIDRKIVYQGIEKILKLSKAQALRKYGLKGVNETAPQCERYKKNSRAYWDCQIQYNSRPENHQAGTCKMGPSTDPMAVVSPHLKVHGVDRLRVADMSIMPQVVTGNPAAAVNMIGERVAHFIKNDYKVINNRVTNEDD